MIWEESLSQVSAGHNEDQLSHLTVKSVEATN